MAQIDTCRSSRPFAAVARIERDDVLNVQPSAPTELQTGTGLSSARAVSERLSRIVLVLILAVLAGIVLIGLGLRVFGYRVVIVSSGSMAPSLERGDLVVVNTRNSTPEVGEVLTFLDRDGEMVTHRVIDVYDGTITTMGDANQRPDTPIEEADSMVGTSSQVIPNVGLPLLSDGFKRIVLGALLLAAIGYLLVRATSPLRGQHRPNNQERPAEATPGNAIPNDAGSTPVPSPRIRTEQPRLRPALFVVEQVPVDAVPGDSAQPH